MNMPIFLELTLAESQTPVLVNVQYIVRMQRSFSGDGTTVFFADDKSFTYDESLAEIQSTWGQ